MCNHPNLGINPVTGGTSSEIASTVRFSYTKCGPEGKWFNAKRQGLRDIKWWSKLVGWKN